MSVIVLLLVARILGALLLLAFVAGIGWVIHQDLRLTAEVMRERQRRYGALRMLGDEEGAESTRFPLLPVTSLGRSPGNTIVLDDTYASAEHALITLRGQQWWLEDLGSRNGTRLNDMPVEGGMVVTAGDVVVVGNTRLRIELD